MASLAQRNLFHDKVRLTVTLTGIVFAIVLIIVQLGLFIGFTFTTSAIIDHAPVDLWITSRGVRNFDVASSFSERKLYQVLGVPGVAMAEKYILRFANWKKPDGGEESVEIVGFNPDTMVGRPWNIVAGNILDLKAPDTVFMDERYKEKLGVTHLGQVVEIRGRRARIVGFTRDIRSFTTSPYIFTSFKNALDYTALNEGQTVYILIKAESGVNLQDLKRRLAAKVPDVDIYTSAEFSRKTQFYWMFTTGAGVALILAALMGLIVGVVVVAQTIYATTVDHIREFGTLKAMGASNTYIYKVIIKQAVMSAVLGYGLGISISVAIAFMSRGGGAAIMLPWQIAAGMLGLTILMCIGAAIISINKVTHIDPAMVFKG